MLKLLYIYFVIADYFPYNICADYFTMSSSANVLLCTKKKKKRGKKARIAGSRDKERAIREMIPFPEFDDAPPGPVPSPGARLIKGDAGERGNEGGLGERRCDASISNFLFPDELACVENVACNVTTRTRERESARESRILSTRARERRGRGRRRRNDGGTR